MVYKTAFKIGDKVSNPHFGVGIIYEVSITEGDIYYWVKFGIDDYGELEESELERVPTYQGNRSFNDVNIVN